MKDFSLQHPREQLVEIMTRIYERGLTTPSGGNISLKDENGNVWVTPSQIDKGRLGLEDIVMITAEGQFVGKHAPTSEYPFHLGIYHTRPDIRAIVHTHPKGLVAFSITGASMNSGILPELAAKVGSVGFTPYHMTGSAELGAAVAEGFAEGHDAVIMENHGIITTGKSLLSAFYRMEMLETLANIRIRARQLGTITEGFSVQEGSRQIPQSDNENTIILSGAIGFEKERNALLDTITRAYQQKLSAATLACWSCRAGEEGFLYNPEGMGVNSIEPGDLIYEELGVSPKYAVYQRYTELHRQIYRLHPEVNAIGCLHPDAVMAFAVTNVRFDTRTIPESYIMLRYIPEVPYGLLEKDPQHIAEMTTGHAPCLLMKNDCLLVTGSTLFQAFDRAEVAEFTASSLINSRQLGELKAMGTEALEAIKQRFNLP